MLYKKQMDGDVLILTAIPEEKQREEGIASIKAEVTRFVEEGSDKVVLDLKNIEFLNSLGIGALVGCARLLHSKKGAMMITGVGLRLAETLFIVNMNKVLPIRLTLSEAVAELRKITKSSEAIPRLALGNPSIEKIHQWWDGILQHQSKINESTASPLSAPSTFPPVSSASSSVLVPAALAPSQTGAWSLPAPQNPPPANIPGAIAPVPGLSAPQERLDNSAMAQEPPLALPPGYRDWAQALDIFRQSKQLWKKRGLNFSADITFKEFIAKLAETLMNE